MISTRIARTMVVVSIVAGGFSVAGPASAVPATDSGSNAIGVPSDQPPADTAAPGDVPASNIETPAPPAAPATADPEPAVEGAPPPAGTSAARLPAAGAATGPTTGNGPASGPGVDAPSNNLAWIARALETRSRSTTAQLTVPAGIPVTNPVEISVLFGDHRISQTYNPATGNRFRHDLPALDGTKRRETAQVHLVDKAPGGKTYTMPVQINIEPLYDVTVSPLDLRILTRCDLVGPVNVEAWWQNVEGNVRNWREDVVVSGRIQQFGGAWFEVSIAEGLLVPQVAWLDDDFGGFAAPAFPGTGEPLLPGTSGIISWVQDEAGGDCNAALTYSKTITLRTYPNL
jgi:hypothetical protein